MPHRILLLMVIYRLELHLFIYRTLWNGLHANYDLRINFSVEHNIYAFITMSFSVFGECSVLYITHFSGFCIACLFVVLFLLLTFGSVCNVFKVSFTNSTFILSVYTRGLSLLIGCSLPFIFTGKACSHRVVLQYIHIYIFYDMIVSC